MALSTIEKELLKYFALFDEPKNQSLLALIKTFLKPGTTERVSVEAYGWDFDVAIERISQREFTILEALEKEMQSW